MNNGEAYWMNVDKPTKRSVLHHAGCRHEHAKQETPHKGIGQLKRDGGWLSFPSRQDADQYFYRELRPKGFASIIECADCC